MAVAGTVGLGGAYFIQKIFVKGNPVPALPPIAVSLLAGLLLVQGMA
jgi:hypothetical protein